MPQHDDDLFTRLRRAGVRKPVAKTLSKLTEDASTKAIDAGRLAVAELRALADEIEKRLPPLLPEPSATSQPTPAIPARRRASPSATKARTTAAKARTTAAKASTTAAKASTTAAKASTKKTSGARPRATTARTRAAAARPAASASSPRPRGENKAEILAALRNGPYTASEVSQETGIARATVSAALTRLTKSGEAVKAERGYGLPK